MNKEEKQIVRLEKVDDKTAYENLLVKYAELENKIADIKANCDLAIEGRDVKIMELETENNKLLDVINNQDVKIADLEKQIEKMKCCGNCNNTWNGMKLDICADCKDHSKWEIKENG